MRRLVCLLTAGLLAGASARAQSSGAFVPLFDGMSLRGWVAQNGSRNFAVAGGVLTVHGSGPTSKCTGDLYSESQYADFTLRMELRLSDSDGGLFIRVPPPLKHDIGLQVQLRDMSRSTDIRASPRLVPWMGNLMRLGPDAPQGATLFDNDAAIRAYRPAGEWQTVEVTAFGTHLGVKVNGISVMSADHVTPAAGHLVLQCEQGVVDIRSLMIREERPSP